MGEIGLPRREFLYDICFWEANRIIRGYRRRHALQYQLQRLTAYSSFFAFRENKDNKTPEEWLELYCDDLMDEKEEMESVLSEEDRQELQELMNNVTI